MLRTRTPWAQRSRTPLMANCPSSSKYFQLKQPCPSRHTLTRYRIRVEHRSQSREEFTLRPSQDFYCCFYPTCARLQPKAKSRPDNSQFSCARSDAGDTCWQLSLSEQPVPGEFLQASSWAPFTQPRTIHICYFLIWLSLKVHLPVQGSYPVTSAPSSGSLSVTSH